MAKTKLEVKHLTISFRTNNGAVRAVRDISFTLNEGETLAIAGESGSGKSVTARAIMGILAPNAVVDNGEILYDGKDLLKISEEDFHTLRGYRLAMVFQDPLSALNPIMRIGQQLTEAMILNNKERRRDGKKQFAAYLAQLEKSLAESGTLTADEAKKECQEYREITEAGVKRQDQYESACEAAVEAQDCVGEMRMYLKRRDEKGVKDAWKRLRDVASKVKDSYLEKEAAALNEALTGAAPAASSYAGADSTKLTDALDKLDAALNALTQNKVSPDFTAICYAASHGMTADPSAESVEEINAKAEKALADGFLNRFTSDAAKACRFTDSQSLARKKEAISVLKSQRAAFTAQPLNRRACEDAIKTAADAVDATIDRLSVDKDSASYVFRSSLTANLNRYFEGCRTNPSEQKRFDRDTRKFEKQVQQGKAALSVVPLNLIDTERARTNMLTSIDELAAQYTREAEAAEKNPKTDEEALARAKRLIHSMDIYAAQASHLISDALAKHHAIELMDEVGIPDPYKRFTQYPFEFSGGMRQRIVIAIALSANPDILICDEPTTALDVTIQAQILELINKLKKQRNLSVIFITHDLGVVANMADRVAVMYAGKIVEYGTADDIFYDPKHPYTWALLSSMPDLETKEKLEAIPGTPPDMIIPPVGDAFAARNKYALQIDYEKQPPMFKVSDTHWAATWLLHPKAPKVNPPQIVLDRIERMKKLQEKQRRRAEAEKKAAEAAVESTGAEKNSGAAQSADAQSAAAAESAGAEKTADAGKTAGAAKAVSAENETQAASAKDSGAKEGSL
ncbi:MAG: oligopeptide/dipeptide ABC transporter ATP-binding protein [Lachnospiraceae bacterium]|jgi:oligopeptide/dipeptide ABC transporter ATP-binding protein